MLTGRLPLSGAGKANSVAPAGVPGRRRPAAAALQPPGQPARPGLHCPLLPWLVRTLPDVMPAQGHETSPAVRRAQAGHPVNMNPGSQIRMGHDAGARQVSRMQDAQPCTDQAHAKT